MSTRAMGPGHGWSWLARAVNLGRNNARAVIGGIALVALVALLPSLVQMLAQQALPGSPDALLAVIGLTTLVSLLVFPPLIGGALRVIDAAERGQPARPGDVIRLEARALDKFIKKDRLFVVHDNVFFNQNDEVICSGRGWTIRPQ